MKMTKLKWLHLYREKFNEEWQGEALSIHDNMNILSGDEAYKIIEYLERGVVVAEFVSPTWDSINPQDKIPHIIYADDQYVWDGVLIHWVRKYRVRLPEEFVEHILTNEGFPDQNEKLYQLDLIDKVKEAETLLLN